jgi:hypothetical protein
MEKECFKCGKKENLFGFKLLDGRVITLCDDCNDGLQ